MFSTVCTRYIHVALAAYVPIVVGEIYIWPLMQLFCGVVQECINMK